jgi:hypothetical protein
MSQNGRNAKRNTSRASCTAFSSLVVTSSVPFATGHGDFSPAVSSCLPHFCLSAVSTPTWKCKNGTPGISRRCTCSQQCLSMSRSLSPTSAGMRLPCSLIAREKKILQCHGGFTHGYPEKYTSVRIEISEEPEPFRHSLETRCYTHRNRH